MLSCIWDPGGGLDFHLLAKPNNSSLMAFVRAGPPCSLGLWLCRGWTWSCWNAGRRLNMGKGRPETFLFISLRPQDATWHIATLNNKALTVLGSGENLTKTWKLCQFFYCSSKKEINKNWKHNAKYFNRDFLQGTYSILEPNCKTLSQSPVWVWLFVALYLMYSKTIKMQNLFYPIL